jgi:hypothetical protein
MMNARRRLLTLNIAAGAPKDQGAACGEHGARSVGCRGQAYPKQPGRQGPQCHIGPVAVLVPNRTLADVPDSSGKPFSAPHAGQQHRIANMARLPHIQPRYLVRPPQTLPLSASHPVNHMVRLRIPQPAVPAPFSITMTSRDCRTRCTRTNVTYVTKITSEVRETGSSRGRGSQ